jgi:Tfp pilus assembly protein PilE
MIVVAIIAILAAVVVPSWFHETMHGRYDPEVRAMFAEIVAKEEAYKSEIGNGAYLAATACPTTVPSATGVDINALITAGTCNANWSTLRVNATDKTIRCQYTVAVGAANSAGSSPTAPASSNLALPASSSTYTAPWYTIQATCDMDNSGSVYSNFYTASWDTSLTKQNYGS